MRLIPISGWEGENFRRRYWELATSPDIASAPKAVKICWMMAELVEHLEDKVVGPDVYAFTSMFGLVLNDKNTSKYQMIRIHAESEMMAVPAGYEIAFSVDAPWSRTYGYAEDVVSAGELVLEALRLAVRDE